MRVAIAFEHLLAIRAALADGTLTWSKVRAITRVAAPELEQTWLEVARWATAAQVEQLAQAFRRASAADAVTQERKRSFSPSPPRRRIGGRQRPPPDRCRHRRPQRDPGQDEVCAQ